MGTNTATVETLTAEVHVLKMGSRQVTNGVYRQLDCVPIEFVEPFGRVHSEGDEALPDIRIIGRDSRNGALVRSEVRRPISLYQRNRFRFYAIHSDAFYHLDYHSPSERRPKFSRRWNDTLFHHARERGKSGDCPARFDYARQAEHERGDSCDLESLEAIALKECNALVDAAIPAVETYQWAERLPLIVLASR